MKLTEKIDKIIKEIDNPRIKVSLWDGPDDKVFQLWVHLLASNGKWKTTDILLDFNRVGDNENINQLIKSKIEKVIWDMEYESQVIKTVENFSTFGSAIKEKLHRKFIMNEDDLFSFHIYVECIDIDESNPFIEVNINNECLDFKLFISEDIEMSFYEKEEDAFKKGFVDNAVDKIFEWYNIKLKNEVNNATV